MLPFIIRYKTAFIFLLLYCVYLVGHFIDVMDVDAAQYASLSSEMATTSSYLEVYHRGADYLDKPPLLFWLSSLAFHLFGVTNFAYHFFPVLFSFLGFYATYRLATLFYAHQVGVLAALMLASSQAVFLMNHDIRTDNLLTTFTIVATWQLIAYLKSNVTRNLLFGSIAVGLAMLAKGPIGLIAPGVAILGYIIFSQSWKSVLKIKWLLGGVIVAILLAPMCWGLYHQFDLHPEKSILNVQGKEVSGLKFFFWTQSFGRITGESQWNNNPGLFFQVSSFLWSFLPWTLFAIAAYLQQTKRMFQAKFRDSSTLLKEGFTWFGVTFLFIALSLSSYQLPHYTYLVYPLIAIFTAQFLYETVFSTAPPKWIRFLKNTQWTILLVFWIGVFMILLFVFPSTNIVLWLFVIVFLATAIYFFVKRTIGYNLILGSFITIVGVNLILNSHFYPNLVTYQSGSQAGKYVKENGIPESQLYCFLTAPYSLDFYAGFPTQSINEGTLIGKLPPGSYYFFTSQQGFDEFIDLKYSVKTIQGFPDFPITNLTFTFLDASQRATVVRNNYLLEITIP